ncbi:hypothetical protein TVAG_442110 [Trichomonas vaginalis G3]|uniref:Uncharacterized protein n=1 Tax=Trichomonas vaginalis (strain ATCC PRA-98 / G3) TaxID=412133 RepID=A2F1V5_TRIV3|nr:hypothetical protein TVAGG3_0505830 [Trichomonas vaginalis G3]EAY01100.1 hypothetical protein TVAG_442110 [Trichomonas vaginalis G3]KAI5517417.1 hypothetical protein TVAGG3_0505830 [Trichomonas vaginalis G3]|eukprot:XP_001313952.1 hypothetical protein [Trichomonas vaginalis G3]
MITLVFLDLMRINLISKKLTEEEFKQGIDYVTESIQCHDADIISACRLLIQIEAIIKEASEELDQFLRNSELIEYIYEEELSEDETLEAFYKIFDE